jgi:hypothetical protein
MCFKIKFFFAPNGVDVLQILSCFILHRRSVQKCSHVHTLILMIYMYDAHGYDLFSLIFFYSKKCSSLIFFMKFNRVLLAVEHRKINKLQTLLIIFESILLWFLNLKRLFDMFCEGLFSEGTCQAQK